MLVLCKIHTSPHATGCEVGWYENGCACGERRALDINYRGDVRSLHRLGFDGVKIDSCGAQKNMTLYAELFNKTGRAANLKVSRHAKVML